LAVLSLTDERRWQVVAHGYGVLVVAVLGYFLLGLTIQVSDSFGNLLAIQEPTFGDVLRDQLWQRGYLRPLLWGQIKAVYELSGGDYFLWFRGIHVLQIAALVALCVHVMRPRTALEAALVPLSLAVIIGAHTFVPLVREAFPINSFLTIAIACVAALALAGRAQPRWYIDTSAIALLIASLLTVESGVLIWVVLVAAYLAGMRGVSRAAVVAMTFCVAVYVLVRFLVLDVGSPSLAERASGFGFTILEPADLVRRFEGRAWIFYAYNILSSISTVLFGEPKGGVWRFIWEMTTGTVHPWTMVSVVSSTAATVLLGWFVWSRRAALRAWRFEPHDRVVIVFAFVLLANAVISYPYTKNVIMSPAGVFLGLAVYAAARAWFQVVPRRGAVLTMVLFTVLTCGWAFRVAGNHYNLRRTAAEKRAEWVSVDRWLDRQRIALDTDQARALRDALRRDALVNHPTPLQPSAQWSRWFDIDW
jgi:hypothetical protein